jgi:hypothetical protein
MRGSWGAGAGNVSFVTCLTFLGGILSGAPHWYWHLQIPSRTLPSTEEFGKLLEQVKRARAALHREETLSSRGTCPA